MGVRKKKKVGENKLKSYSPEFELVININLYVIFFRKSLMLVQWKDIQIMTNSITKLSLIPRSYILEKILFSNESNQCFLEIWQIPRLQQEIHEMSLKYLYVRKEAPKSIEVSTWIISHEHKCEHLSFSKISKYNYLKHIKCFSIHLFIMPFSTNPMIMFGDY